MANFDFDMFKKKAGQVADKSILLAKKAADKAVAAAKITKINTEIISEKDKMKKAYQQIGKIYYDLYKDAPDAEFTQAIEALEAAKAAIRAKRAEIEEIKTANTDDVGINIDDADIYDADFEPDIEVEIVQVEEDGIPETEEACEGDICTICDEPTEDSIPETEEAPLEDIIKE